MPTISIRVDDKTYEDIEKRRGDVNKSEYYRKLIEDAIKNSDDRKVQTDDTSMHNDYIVIKAKIEWLEELIRAKEQTIKNLENQNGFLIQEHTRLSGQVDRLLLPAPAEPAKEKHRFWEFWK